MDPTLILGLDLMAKGVCFDDVLAVPPSPNTPTILMLDEYDAAIDYALGVRTGASDTSCLAESKPRLLAFMDRLASMPNVVVIATTNTPLAELNAKERAPFVRVGRLDMYINV